LLLIAKPCKSEQLERAVSQLFATVRHRWFPGVSKEAGLERAGLTTTAELNSRTSSGHCW
jgi:hypothetical protein